MRALFALLPAAALGVFLASRTTAAHNEAAIRGGVSAVAGVDGRAGEAGHGTPLKAAAGHELAAFSMGCFWGSEDIYRHVKGVTGTSVGYTGGTKTNPTYDEVCTHTTRHAETVLVEYDPKKVTYAKLLDVFWENHDSTEGDRQGPDEGDSYRSAIWTIGPDQAKLAAQARDAFQKKLRMKITTQVEPLGPFWIAEEYHQQYHEKTHTATCPFPKPPKIGG